MATIAKCKVVGWAMSPSLATELVSEVLRQAMKTRRPICLGKNAMVAFFPLARLAGKLLWLAK